MSESPMAAGEDTATSATPATITTGASVKVKSPGHQLDNSVQTMLGTVPQGSRLAGIKETFSSSGFAAFPSGRLDGLDMTNSLSHRSSGCGSALADIRPTALDPNENMLEADRVTQELAEGPLQIDESVSVGYPSLDSAALVVEAERGADREEDHMMLSESGDGKRAKSTSSSEGSGSKREEPLSSPFDATMSRATGHPIRGYSSGSSSSNGIGQGETTEDSMVMASSSSGSDPAVAGVTTLQPGAPTCQLCGFVVDSMEALSAHARAEHEEITSIIGEDVAITPLPATAKPIENRTKRNKVYRCKQCNLESPTKELHWQHSRQHIRADKVLRCPKCSFITEYKHHLEYHVRNHYGSKPFRCHKCSYACVNKSMLNSHMKSHSDKFLYYCNDCNYHSKYCHSMKQHTDKYGHTCTAPHSVHGSSGAGSVNTGAGPSSEGGSGPARRPRGPGKTPVHLPDASHHPLGSSTGPPALMKAPGAVKHERSPIGQAPGLVGSHMLSPTSLQSSVSAMASGSNPLMMPPPAFWHLGGMPPSAAAYFNPVHAAAASGFPEMFTQGAAAAELKRTFGKMLYDTGRPIGNHVLSAGTDVRDEEMSAAGKFGPQFSPQAFMRTPSFTSQGSASVLSPSPSSSASAPGSTPSAALTPAYNSRFSNSAMIDRERMETDRVRHLSGGQPQQQRPSSSGSIVSASGPDRSIFSPRSDSSGGTRPVFQLSPLGVGVVPPAGGFAGTGMPGPANKSLPSVLQRLAEGDPPTCAPLDLTLVQPPITSSLTVPTGPPPMFPDEDTDLGGRRRSRKGKAYRLDTLPMEDEFGTITSSLIASLSSARASAEAEMMASARPERLHVGPTIGESWLRNINVSSGSEYAKTTPVTPIGMRPGVGPGVSLNVPGSERYPVLPATGASTQGASRSPGSGLHPIHCESSSRSGSVISDVGLGDTGASASGGRAASTGLTSHGKESEATEGTGTGSSGARKVSSGSGGAEYECSYCEIKFRDCVMYTMHMGYHGYRDPFKCNMCGVDCGDKLAFFLHIARTAHP